MLDFRLASAALAAWAATAWALARQAPQVALAAAGSLVAGALFVLAGRGVKGIHVWALAASAIALVLAPLSVRLHHARDSDFASLARMRAEVTAELVVTGDPRPLAARGPNGSSRSAIPARIEAIQLRGRRIAVDGAVLVLAPFTAWRSVVPGQAVHVDARLAPPLAGDLLTATLTATGEPRLVGRPPWWQRAASAVRDGLRHSARGLPRLPRGLLPGLVDGDTSQLDPVLAERFRIAGLTHLVAVSGTNCSILVGTVALFLRRLRASPATIATVGLFVVIAFVMVARPSPSVLRAAVMAALALFGLATGRQRSTIPILSAAVLLLLCWQPTLALDLGFALSVSATASLLVFARGWAAALRARGVPAMLAEAFAVAGAAHVATAPIIAGISGQFSLVAIPANILAEPVVAAATVLGVCAAVLSVTWMPLAVVLAQLAGWPCRWLVWVAETFGSLPGASLPWPSGLGGGALLALASLALLASLRCSGPRSLICVAVIVSLAIQIPVRTVVIAWPATGWFVVACDVGQGDALAISAGSHAAVVVDAGPDPVPVDRCLRSLGVTRIPLLILTHSHLDHVGGILGVLHGRTVGAALTSPLTDPVGGYRLARDALGKQGVQLGTISVGSALQIGAGAGAVTLQVLGPAHLFKGSRSDPNNSSVIVKATVRGRSILLCGDAEVEAQDELLASEIDLRADVLKVAHHGSAYSDPAFLAAVHAHVALISVGEGNAYGHPSPLLMGELARLGVPVYRTDLMGDIAVAVSENRLEVGNLPIENGG